MENGNWGIFFFSLSENSRLMENGNRGIFFFFFFFDPSILVLWKTRIGEFFFFFFFFIRELSFCGKREM